MAEERHGELLRLIDDFTDHSCIIVESVAGEVVIRVEQANAEFGGRLEQRLTREQQIRLRDALTQRIGDRGADLGIRCKAGCGAALRVPLDKVIALGGIGGHGDPGGYAYVVCQSCGTEQLITTDNLAAER